MLGNRKDPLADVVKKVMDHNENERRIIAEFNSELGIKDRRQLPHEKRAAYDQALSERLNEETLDEATKITHIVPKDKLAKHKEWMDSEGYNTKTKALPKDHPKYETHVGIIAKSPVEAGYHEDGYAKSIKEATSPENYSAKQKQLAANAGDPKKIDAPDLKKVRMQGHIEEEGSVPTTAREKDLAAMKPPHDKITHADVLKGRGVIKQEEKEYKGDEAPFEADEKKSTPWTNPRSKARQLAREMMNQMKAKQMKAKKEKKLDEEQIDEVSTEKLVAYKNKAGEGREKGSKLAYAKLTGKAKVKASMPKTPYMEEDIQQSGKEKPPVSTIDRMKDPNPPEKYTPKFGAENPNTGTKASAEDKAALQKKIEDIKEATYSAKAARAGKDIGKPGKMFSKIAKKAGEKYGSEERGKKVAGAVLAKIRAKHMKEEEQIDEVSKGLAKKYAKSAVNDLADRTDPNYGYITDKPIDDVERGAENRRKGIQRAIKILSKEEEQIDEKTLTSAETSKKEELVKKMKKGDWSERYGKRGKEVMYATATKMAKKLAEEEVSIDSIQEEIRNSLLEKANWLKENGTQEQVVEFLNNLTMEQREILNLAEAEPRGFWGSLADKIHSLGPQGRQQMSQGTHVTQQPGYQSSLPSASTVAKTAASAIPGVGAAVQAADIAPKISSSVSSVRDAIYKAGPAGRAGIPNPRTPTPPAAPAPAAAPAAQASGSAGSATPENLARVRDAALADNTPNVSAEPPASAPAGPTARPAAPAPKPATPRPAAPTPSTSSVDTSGGSRYGKGGGLEYADRHQVYESKSGKSLEKFLKEDFNGKKS